MRLIVAQLLLTLPLAAQQPAAADPVIDRVVRSAVIEKLLSGIQTGYVIPENAEVTIQAIRAAESSGTYEMFGAAKAFADKLTLDLLSASHDKHLAVFFDPESTPTKPSSAPIPSRERFNFGFNEVQRLRGNVGYLDLRSFADLDEARETASTWLSALANFDAIILDLRQNGGGNTPMVGYVASYFFSSVRRV